MAPTKCHWHGAEDATDIECERSDSSPCMHCYACYSAIAACSCGFISHEWRHRMRDAEHMAATIAFHREQERVSNG